MSEVLLPLPLKYRPEYFDEIVGNKSAVEAIEKLLTKDIGKIPKTWMFIGESGCGKTTLARIVKEELGCNDLDFYEINGSNNRKIADMRQLQEKIVVYPRAGDIKIYLIDEAHRLTPEAQDSILKMLEEPPAHAYIFLATTNPEKLIKTIHSRCTIIRVAPVSSKDMLPFINYILEEEIGTDEAAQFPDDVLKAVVKNSGGACRDALKLLDLIMNMEDFDEMIEVMEQGIPQEGSLKEFCDLLKSPRTKWTQMATFLRGFHDDPEKVRRQAMRWFTTMLLNDGSKRTRLILLGFAEENYFDSGKAGLVGTCFDIIHSNV